MASAASYLVGSHAQQEQTIIIVHANHAVIKINSRCSKHKKSVNTNQQVAVETETESVEPAELEPPNVFLIGRMLCLVYQNRLLKKNRMMKRAK